MPTRRPALAALSFALLLAIAPAVADDGITDITGKWVDAEKSGGRISIDADDEGLIQVSGSDDASTYKLDCISTGPVATCVGAGKSTSGVGFIYQSLMRLTKEGDLVETWLVRSSVEEKSGQTLWKRQG